MNLPQRKPPWLKVRFPASPGYSRIDRIHRELGLHTVCRSAACPNQGECWSQGTATFMILGNCCSRDCRFCNVAQGPGLQPDPAEIEAVATAVAELGLNHAVITSVTRDDLPDGGATQFAAVTLAIRAAVAACRVELLIPDLAGNLSALQTVLDARPQVLGHNLETVPRLYPLARAGASYRRSLNLLDTAHKRAPEIPAKSGLMLGLGEEPGEIFDVLSDLRSAGVTMLTLGQYLQPSRLHLPVVRYLPPAEFADLHDAALSMGFTHVAAGPLVRSSYHAAELFDLKEPSHEHPRNDP